VLILIAIFATFMAAASSRDRAVRIEAKLDAVLAHLGVDLVAKADAEVRRLAQAGDKIGAIKKYRELTGVGLAEAKTQVELLQSMSGTRRP
jgi:ribosomal protein L7/L12